ncbi:hypothetical protein BDV12DRAFT_196232 [Aspergillus spectabilis]
MTTKKRLRQAYSHPHLTSFFEIFLYHKSNRKSIFNSQYNETNWYFGTQDPNAIISVQSLGNRTMISLPGGMTIMAGEEVSFSYSTTRGFSIAPCGVRGARGNRNRNPPGPRGPVHANPPQNRQGQSGGGGRRNRNRGRGRGGRGGPQQAVARAANANVLAPIPLPANPLHAANGSVPADAAPAPVPAPVVLARANEFADQIQETIAEVVASLNAPLEQDTETQLDEADDQDWQIVTGASFEGITTASDADSDVIEMGAVPAKGSNCLVADTDLMEFADQGSSTSTL